MLVDRWEISGKGTRKTDIFEEAWAKVRRTFVTIPNYNLEMTHATDAPSKSNARHVRRRPTIAVLWARHFNAQAAVTYASQLRRRGIRVYITGVHQQKIQGENGIALYTDTTLHDLLATAKQIDGVIVPAGACGLQTIAYEPRFASLFSHVGQRNGVLVTPALAEPALKAMGIPLDGLKLIWAKPEICEIEASVEQLLQFFESSNV